ncbi:I78 family peptidase inhibitor [Streptomyces sp. NPDC088197]|uniref:I78 family peptidase inhibitor n=1 Tax=unclassified Streptomyces TaxID=2593676 RepID=UPI0016620792|nr:I78 family peptidase inhibitor [Streptomyces sp. CBMA29]MBD0740284.1 proteinase inhibitor I78 [Streptomyces sp. CBMA29]
MPHNPQTPQDPRPPRSPADDPDAYTGLDAREAERLAEQRGWQTVRSLPPGAIVTMEYVVGRLNFTVEGGRVQRCWVG